MFAQESVMDIQELGQFESVYKPSKEVAFCWLRKQYVQLSTEEDHTEIANHANDSLRIWQAAKAQAVPKGFVLIKDDTKTVVAIERMVEQQVEASGMDSRRLERLDGWKIIEAAVKAQEPAND